MTKLLTPNFRTYMARQFIESFVGRERSVLSESISRYVEYAYVAPNYTEEFFVRVANDDIEFDDVGYFYMFAGVPAGWVNGVVETPTNAVGEFHYNVYDTMLFGKHAVAADVSHMIDRHDWTSGEIYAQYDHTDPILNQKNFYVVTQENNGWQVFKCLDNNGGSPSTHMPSVFEYNSSTGAIITSGTAVLESNYYYKTSDSYVWMYLYSITDVNFKKFATVDYAPLPFEVSASPPPIGSLSSIVVSDQGAYHNAYTTGSIKKINVNGSSQEFHVNTDGNDFFTILNVYKNSAIYVTSGKGAGQIRGVSSSTIEGTERKITVDSPFFVSLDATSRFEIGPKVNITGDGTGALARSILTDGRLTQIEMISPGSGYSYAAATITTVTGYYDQGGAFIATQTVGKVYPIVAPPRGHARDLINDLYADKVCISVDFEGINHPISDFSQYGLIVDPLFTEVVLTVDDASGFEVGEILIQQGNGTYGVVGSFDTTTNDITAKNVRGVFSVGGTMLGTTSNNYATCTAVSKNTDTFEIGDIVDNSGEILLINNDVTVSRASGQTERVKLIVDF